MIRLTQYLLTGFVWLGGAATALAFVPAVKKSEELVQAAEEQFQVRMHAELHRFVRQDASGEVVTGRMFIIYRYLEERVDGVFRVLPDGDSPGAVLVMNHPQGNLPSLFLHEPAAGISKKLPMRERVRKLGPTDWYLEGIYDDDKNPWSWKPIGFETVRNERCSVIEGRYTNADLARSSVASFRRGYLATGRENRRFLRANLYDRQGDLLYSLDIPSHIRIPINGRPQLRGNRIHLNDWKAGSTTLLVLDRGVWDEPLDDKLFSFAFAPKWDTATDEALLARMAPPGE
ncbi:MAG: hypothetical protein ACFE0O_04695 [Opitutales bacterium]